MRAFIRSARSQDHPRDTASHAILRPPLLPVSSDCSGYLREADFQTKGPTSITSIPQRVAVFACSQILGPDLAASFALLPAQGCPHHEVDDYCHGDSSCQAASEPVPFVLGPARVVVRSSVEVFGPVFIVYSWNTKPW